MFEKEKMLVSSIFYFSYILFLLFQTNRIIWVTFHNLMDESNTIVSAFRHLQ